MFFKLSSRNAFRDFVRNARKIALSGGTAQTKMQDYTSLYALLSPRLQENERNLNSSPAFSKRCEHWNQRDISSIRVVTTANNPWILFKREFEQALNEVQTLGSHESSNAISRALAWFYATEHRDDWIND